MDGPQSFHLRKTEGIKEVLEERGIWMKKTNHQGGVKGLLIAIALLCIVLGYYFYLSNRGTCRAGGRGCKTDRSAGSAAEKS